jgi:hypothetical protein
MPSSVTRHPSSFRDPSGFMFGKDGVLYRQVNVSYKEHFEKFRSGLYQDLVRDGSLVSHEEIRENMSGDPNWLTTLKPDPLPIISYPYEWSFSMIKDAALLTLRICRKAMEHEMILKDATPFNVQFRKGKPIFIDSLSFEIYDETRPWIAYRQFCECFLSPLLVAHHTQMPVHAMMLAYPEGVPLRFASSLLPRKTRFNLHTYLHVHLHARAGERQPGKKELNFSRKKLKDILRSLEILVNKCEAPRKATAWSGYYEEAEGREDYLQRKEALITGWTSPLDFNSILDLGGNSGRFSRLLLNGSRSCVVTDADSNCIDALYRSLSPENNTAIQPLVIDLAWPTPALGLGNRERESFIERVQGTKLVMALALVHHLAIAKNIPFDGIATFFSEITGRYLLIEFVPKDDEKVRQMLANRPDIFNNYDQENFEASFEMFFGIRQKEIIGKSGRTLYLMTKK